MLISSIVFDSRVRTLDGIHELLKQEEGTENLKI